MVGGAIAVARSAECAAASNDGQDIRLQRQCRGQRLVFRVVEGTRAASADAGIGSIWRAVETAAFGRTSAQRQRRQAGRDQEDGERLQSDPWLLGRAGGGLNQPIAPGASQWNVPIPSAMGCGVRRGSRHAQSPRWPRAATLLAGDCQQQQGRNGRPLIHPRPNRHSTHVTDSSRQVTQSKARGPHGYVGRPQGTGVHDPARQTTVSIRVVRGLVAALEQRGIPRAVFLRSAQFCPEQLACVEARVTRAELFRLCELALDMTADPALGLHWGEKPRRSAFNPIADLIAHSATLRDGLEALCQFHPLLSDEASFQLSEDADNVTVRCLPLAGAPEHIDRFVSEMRVVGLFLLLRAFNIEARLQRASFEYRAPSYHREYTRVFEGAECFEQPLTGIVFDRALMETVSPHQDEDTHDALRAIAERQMSRKQRASFALRVRELLLQKRCARPIKMTSVARSLGLSVRSLRRRLVAEDVSYAAVANDALAMVAKHCLVAEQRSIQETAYEMGFSDPSAFRRAFKRWTGTTPDAFRNSRLG